MRLYHHSPLLQINPLTNCVVDARFEGAREDARRIDAEIAVAFSEGRADSLFAEKPLLGIPFTAKDCFNVKGLSWEDCHMTALITYYKGYCSRPRPRSENCCGTSHLLKSFMFGVD